jgi:site-specific DNA-methyltransferase (adenine-specific)
MKYPEDYINKIICGDCLEVMKGIPDKAVDLIITSPPYNLGNDHHTGTIKHKTYEDDIPEQDYQLQQQEFLSIWEMKLKDNGSIFYNHKNRIKNGQMITPYTWILITSFVIKQELVWFNGSQNFDKIRFYPMTERIYWLARNANTKFFNHINHHDFFEWQPEGTEKMHKRAFPLSMPMSILQCFPKDSIVLDPYMGSGTVAVACKELGMNYIGIEQNPEYIEIAQRRLAQEYLFT